MIRKTPEQASKHLSSMTARPLTRVCTPAMIGVENPEPEASDTATARPKPLWPHRRDQHGHATVVELMALFSPSLCSLLMAFVRDALHAHARLRQLPVRHVFDVSLTDCFSSRACLLPPPLSGLMVRANCTPCSASSFLAASVLPSSPPCPDSRGVSRTG